MLHFQLLQVKAYLHIFVLDLVQDRAPFSSLTSLITVRVHRLPTLFSQLFGLGSLDDQQVLERRLSLSTVS